MQIHYDIPESIQCVCYCCVKWDLCTSQRRKQDDLSTCLTYVCVTVVLDGTIVLHNVENRMIHQHALPECVLLLC